MKNPFNMFYPLFAIALLTLFFSCGGNGCRTAGKDGCIVLDMEQALDNGAVDVPLSKYATSIRYVPLSTGENSFVADVDWMESCEEYFYVASVRTDEVNEFTVDGKFVRKIGRQGRGPGEYSDVGGLFLFGEQHEYNSGIGIMSHEKSLLYYRNGEYVRALDGIGAYGARRANSVEYLGNGKFATVATRIDTADASVEIEYLNVIDTLGNLLAGFMLGEAASKKVNLPLEAISVTVDRTLPSCCYIYNGEINIVKGAIDTIYAYSCPDYARRVRYEARFGKYDVAVYHTAEMDESMDFFAGNVFETDDFLLILGFVPPKYLRGYDFVGNQTRCEVVYLYDKARGRTVILSQDKRSGMPSFVNDLDGGMGFHPMFIENGRMYQVVDATDFMEEAEKSSSLQMKQVASQLTEDSNPVIVEVTLKK